MFTAKSSIPCLEAQSLSQLIAGMIYHKFANTALRPLSTDAESAINTITSRGADQATLRTFDLITMARNSRTMVRAANRLWRTGPQNKETDNCRAEVARLKNRVSTHVLAALVERFAAKFCGLDGRSYSTSAAWHYAYQEYLLGEMELEPEYLLREASPTAA